MSKKKSRSHLYGTMRTELTPLQYEIITHLCAGASDQEIADRVYKSKVSIRYHLPRIYKKMRVATRNQAIVVGLQEYVPIDQVVVPRIES